MNHSLKLITFYKAFDIAQSKMEYSKFKFIQLKTILQNCGKRNLNIRDGRWGKRISSELNLRLMDIIWLI